MKPTRNRLEVVMVFPFRLIVFRPEILLPRALTLWTLVTQQRPPKVTAELVAHFHIRRIYSKVPFSIEQGSIDTVGSVDGRKTISCLDVKGLKT
jgi:hypothetical protein